VKKKLERVLVNPSTKQRMLVPPKMVVGFKPNSGLKDKVNGK
jgi:nucleoid DNA-binding protein